MKEPIRFVDEYLSISPETLRVMTALHKGKGGSMKKTYINVHVHDDGDNELTKLDLTPQEVEEKLYGGDLCFDVETQTQGLIHELIDYGNEEAEVNEALTYILAAQPGESCIVGKV
jgi:hypothetical protein